MGGFTVNAHGFSRATGDLDLWVKDRSENRNRLADVAASAGIAGAEQLTSMEWVPDWTGFRLKSGFEVEVMSYIAGFSTDDFNACQQRAKIIQLGEIPIPILGLEDLIHAKSELTRPKDQEDLRQLRHIREIRGKK